MTAGYCVLHIIAGDILFKPFSQFFVILMLQLLLIYAHEYYKHYGCIKNYYSNNSNYYLQ